MIRFLLACLLLLLAAPLAAQERILVMGDSMMAAHKNTGRSVGDVLGTRLGAEMRINALAGARMIYRLPLSGAIGFNISRQFRGGPYDWVVLNGGGNDLWLGCGCGDCDRTMDRLIGTSGRSGRIPELVQRLRDSGARVIYAGYLRSPGRDSVIEHCIDEGAELEARLARMAEGWPGVDFVSLDDLVPYGDGSFHSWDRIHPSPSGSAAIAERIADVIEARR